MERKNAGDLSIKTTKEKGLTLRIRLHTLRSEFECWKPEKAKGHVKRQSRIESHPTQVLIAAKCFLEPAFELAKQKLQVGSGRFLEEFDEAWTQILFRLIDRA